LAAVGAQQYARYTSRKCQTDSDAQLAGVWDDAVRERWKAGFEATGSPFATQSLSSARATIDRYASQWRAAMVELCELKGPEDSGRTARRSCLAIRRKELAAVTQLLAAPDNRTVASAVLVASSLAPVSECASPRNEVATLSLPGQEEKIGDLRADLARAGGAEITGEYEKAAEIARRVARVAAELRNPALQSEALYLQARFHWLLNQNEEAKRTALDAVVLANGAGHTSALVKSQALLSRIYIFAFDRFAGIAWLRMAESSLQRGEATPLLKAHVARTRGSLHPSTAAEALRNLEQQQLAYALSAEALGREHPETVGTLISLAEQLFELSRYEEALELQTEATRIRRRLHAPDNPQLLGAELYRAAILRSLGRAQEALDIAQPIYQKLEVSDGRLGYYTLGALVEDLPLAYLKLGRKSEAVASAREGLARALEAQDVEAVVMAKLSLGMALADDAPKEAVTLLEAVLAEHESIHLIQRANAKWAMARALIGSKGDPERASKLAFEARDEFRQLVGHKKDAEEVEKWLGPRR
jgi:tetratricopeptide (TPR) repeat protein